MDIGKRIQAERTRSVRTLNFVNDIAEYIETTENIKLSSVEAGMGTALYCITEERTEPRPLNNFYEKAIWIYPHRTKPFTYMTIFNEYQNKPNLEQLLRTKQNRCIEGESDWIYKDSAETDQRYLDMFKPVEFNFLEKKLVVDKIIEMFKKEELK